MYVPSGEVYNLIANEKVGVWSETYDSDNKAALMVKISANVIKTVAAGCKLELIVGVVYVDENKGVLCVAVNIHDTIDYPFLVVMPPRLESEKEGVLNLLLKDKVKVVFFNELSHSVCSGIGSLAPSLIPWSEEYLPDNVEIILPASAKMCNEVVDSFSYEIDRAYGTDRIYNAEICKSVLAIESYDSLLIQSIESAASISYHATSGDPGLTQEEQIEHVFMSMPGVDVYHSPEVQIGNKRRELTDVLANSQGIYYLIESKAIVLESGDIPLSRKKSKVLKSANKAILQLEGAMKAIRRLESVYTSEGVTLEISKDAQLHGIVLVSEFYELMEDDEWKAVVEKLYEVYSAVQGKIHVMDTSEFYYILKLSQQSQHKFESGMQKRFDIFHENGRLDIQSMDSSLPYL